MPDLMIGSRYEEINARLESLEKVPDTVLPNHKVIYSVSKNSFSMEERKKHNAFVQFFVNIYKYVFKVEHNRVNKVHKGIDKNINIILDQRKDFKIEIKNNQYDSAQLTDAKDNLQKLVDKIEEIQQGDFFPEIVSKTGSKTLRLALSEDLGRMILLEEKLNKIIDLIDEKLAEYQLSQTTTTTTPDPTQTQQTQQTQTQTQPTQQTQTQQTQTQPTQQTQTQQTQTQPTQQTQTQTQQTQTQPTQQTQTQQTQTQPTQQTQTQQTQTQPTQQTQTQPDIQVKKTTISNGIPTPPPPPPPGFYKRNVQKMTPTVSTPLTQAQKVRFTPSTYYSDVEIDVLEQKHLDYAGKYDILKKMKNSNSSDPKQALVPGVLTTDDRLNLYQMHMDRIQTHIDTLKQGGKLYRVPTQTELEDFSDNEVMVLAGYFISLIGNVDASHSYKKQADKCITAFNDAKNGVLKCWIKQNDNAWIEYNNNLLEYTNVRDVFLAEFFKRDALNAKNLHPALNSDDTIVQQTHQDLMEEILNYDPTQLEHVDVKEAPKVQPTIAQLTTQQQQMFDLANQTGSDDVSDDDSVDLSAWD